MLVSMRRKGNTFALLVGMQTGTATLENNMEVPQKIKNRNTLQPSQSTSGYFTKAKKNIKFKKTYAPLCSLQHYLKYPRCRGAWVAQSVKRPTSARSRSRGLGVRAPCQALG